MRASTTTRTRTTILWTIQILLAGLFLFAGVMKLLTPVAALEAQSHLSGEFLQFIGVAETLGGLGLILPGLFRVHQELTPLAAIGLAIIMGGATVITVLGAGLVAGAAVPFVIGLLLSGVAYARRATLVRARGNQGPYFA